MAAIERVIRWKQKLLDLGKRNRLLFFRPTKRTTLRLVSPSSGDIFHRLVSEGRLLQFPQQEPRPFELDSENDTQPTAGQVPKQVAIAPGQVLADQSGGNLEKSLYQLRNKARTAVEEQGVSILFVAFGFLEWTESDASQDIIRSPLVLVPVELQQESILEPYRLVPLDDDLVLNPTLIHKLGLDFGITLPDLPGEEDWELDDLLDQVEQLVSKRGWRVAREAYLSLFSFLKLNMYKDLDRHAQEMAEHPLIGALAGDPSKMPPLPDDVTANLDLDRHIQPHETYQVVDADSSQQEAILAAKRGASFVLQGPPGTGKSQTITNMIAECLAAGKRVLFVSEKMAALEVVFRRVADAGLADFCLQLHSHNANKKEVVDELGRTLMADKTQITASALEQLDTLITQRETLNAFVHALHTVREPLGRTVYQIHGEVAKLETAPDATFSLDKVGSRTPADLNRYRILLDQLANTARRVGEDYFSNPWKGCTVPAFTLELQHDITARFGRLNGLLDRMAELLNLRASHLGLASAGTLQEMESLAEILALAGDSPQPPAEWLLSATLEPLVKKASAYQDAQIERQSLRSELLRSYQETVLTLEARTLATVLTDGVDEALKTLRPEYISAPESLLDQRSRLVPFLEQVATTVGTLLQAGEELAALLGVESPRTTADFRRLAFLAEQVAKDPRPEPCWFDPSRYRVVAGLAKEAGENFERLADAESSLFSRFDREVLSQGIPELLQRFRTDYNGFLRFLNSGYRRDMKALRSLLKSPAGFSYQQAIADLRLMKEVLDRRAWEAERESAMVDGFGAWYQRTQTDWVALSIALGTVGDIAAHFRPDRTVPALQNLLVHSGAPIRQTAAQLEKLSAVFTQLTALLEPIRTRSPVCRGDVTSELMDKVDLPLVREWAKTALSVISPVYQAYDTVRANSTGGVALSLRRVVTDVRAVQRVQTIESDMQAHLTEFKEAFGRFYQGVETEWPAVFRALDWVETVQAHFAPGRPPIQFAELICTDQEAARLARETATTCGSLLELAKGEASFVASLFEPHLVNVVRMTVATAKEWLQLRLLNLAALEDWVDFCQSREQCAAAGLGQFVNAVLQNQIPPDAIKPAFFKRFYRLWVDDIYSRVPELQMFRGRRHQERIEDFRHLDKTQFRIAQSRLRAKLSELRPNPHIMAARGSEVAILLRETEKRRKLKPLRKLFQEIPNLLLTLKPCLMMSPLSVSQYLDPLLYRFDTVIFDEASQICSENAIGAIFRGQQVVVVGDREQLPPTNFFSVSVGDGGFDDEEDDTEAYESILDECSGVLHRKSLQWHYRSRHEHLIAFSNAEIYRNLVTFPSPAGRGPGQGVEFVAVPDGVYDRAGTRANKVEAQRVAEMVFAHFLESPNRSLGVVTFSEAQQSTIDATVRQLRVEHPEMEPFFRSERQEPFFIKNLENVQGDERDTIIFGVGYARDQTGVMHMNFGPLSRQGGYRRLNVAITRAKYNVKLVSSIKPTDIDLDRTGAEGVRMLRNYMEFAMQGPEALQRELRVSSVPEFDSPFEEAVYRELVCLGLPVDTQVGCSGYRIDLAIRHPELNGHYLLGIECDGRAYHSAKTARDRDRLREDVLRGLGWKIHRIWSSDWVKDPRAEINRLLGAVEKAKAESGDGKHVSAPVEVRSEPELPLEVAISAEEEAEALDLLPGTMEYAEADIWSVARQPGQGDAEYAAAVIAHVIGVEGPIHQDLLARRVAPLYGRERAGSQLKRHLEWMVQANGKGRWVQRGDFLWESGKETPPIRVPKAQEKPRPIGHVCVEERAEAAMLVLQRAMGMSLDDLIVETARVLGFSRTGDQIREALLEAVAMLETVNRVELREGTVRPMRN